MKVFERGAVIGQNRRGFAADTHNEAVVGDWKLFFTSAMIQVRRVFIDIFEQHILSGYTKSALGRNDMDLAISFFCRAKRRRLHG